MTADELREWRQSKELSMQSLADLLGVTKGAVSLWESGKRLIPNYLHLALKCLKVKKGGITAKGKKGKEKKK